jgi:hypothetical protein
VVVILSCGGRSSIRRTPAPTSGYAGVIYLSTAHAPINDAGNCRIAHVV